MQLGGLEPSEGEEDLEPMGLQLGLTEDDHAALEGARAEGEEGGLTDGEILGEGERKRRREGDGEAEGE